MNQPKKYPISTMLLTLICAISVGAVLPVNYVVESPGPTFNTLGNFDGEEFVQVKGREHYRTDGDLAMTTVRISGGPGRTLNGAQVLVAAFNPLQDVAPTAMFYAEDETRENIDQANQVMMETSQSDAVAAALTQLHIPYQSTLQVKSFTPESPAQKILAPNDVLQKVDGEKITGLSRLKKRLAETQEDHVQMTVLRNGKSITKEVPVYTSTQGQRVIGVFLQRNYDFPFQVRIGLEDVGGPSAGMMFALAIMDKLTPESLTSGEKFAGTGTIDADGTVGPIGGITQKVHGARAQGYKYFLAPESNCADLAGRIPEGMTVFSVKDLSQARHIVQNIRRWKQNPDAADNMPLCASTR